MLQEKDFVAGRSIASHNLVPMTTGGTQDYQELKKAKGLLAAKAITTHSAEDMIGVLRQTVVVVAMVILPAVAAVEMQVILQRGMAMEFLMSLQLHGLMHGTLNGAASLPTIALAVAAAGIVIHLMIEMRLLKGRGIQIGVATTGEMLVELAVVHWITLQEDYFLAAAAGRETKTRIKAVPVAMVED